MRILGRCHCGNIAFEVDWRPEPSEIPARACSCAFCRKHGGVWTSCPTARVSVTITDRARTSRYRFGTGTAAFHVCSVCGVVPLVTSRIEGRTYAVVNVNTLEGIEPAMLKPSPVSFEGEEPADRLARRARGWIPDVRFVAGGDV